ncbi:hypothetical protein [Rhizobium sp. RU36D]|uniref:hypothetical protein n=1 Tax=Rhizobium sp. RU36D TaxID=1907415 RepID=UPI0009FF973A|nr:hypothetical protein [Rhizobium sp. RU36D]
MKTLWDIVGATLIGAVIVTGSSYAAPLLAQSQSDAFASAKVSSEPLASMVNRRVLDDLMSSDSARQDRAISTSDAVNG